MTEQEAKDIYFSRVWEQWTDYQICEMFFGPAEFRLFCEFNRLHAAVESVLKRPVFTHEFMFKDKLTAEFRRA
jgi:hypothetical protein